MPHTQKLLFKKLMMSWSYDIICDTPAILRESFKGQRSEAGGSAKLPARTTWVHLPFLPCCPRQQVFLACLTQEEQDSSGHTKRISQAQDRSIRVAVYHYICSPHPLEQNLMRAGTLSAFCTAQSWHVILSKHCLNEYGRVAVRARGTWNLNLESLFLE